MRWLAVLLMGLATDATGQFRLQLGDMQPDAQFVDAGAAWDMIGLALDGTTERTSCVISLPGIKGLPPFEFALTVATASGSKLTLRKYRDLTFLGGDGAYFKPGDGVDVSVAMRSRDVVFDGFYFSGLGMVGQEGGRALINGQEVSRRRARDLANRNMFPGGIQTTYSARVMERDETGFDQGRLTLHFRAATEAEQEAYDRRHGPLFAVELSRVRELELPELFLQDGYAWDFAGSQFRVQDVEEAHGRWRFTLVAQRTGARYEGLTLGAVGGTIRFAGITLRCSRSP